MEETTSHRLLALVEEYVDRSWHLMKYSPFCIFRLSPDDGRSVVAYLKDKAFQDDIERIRQGFLIKVIDLFHFQPLASQEIDLIVRGKLKERTPIFHVESVKGITLLFECTEEKAREAEELHDAVSNICDWFMRVDIIKCIEQWQRSRKPIVLLPSRMAGLV
ncbi:MAG TPA: hypothetical protein VLH40_00500 [Atribacteraceae bacterium]|nr:hypothetical protein [Atribacteraceae bacterium]